MLQLGNYVVEGVAFVEVSILGGEQFREWAASLFSDNLLVGDDGVLDDGPGPDLASIVHDTRQSGAGSPMLRSELNR